MALASSTDVELALGRDLATDEDVSNLLDTASDLVISYLGQEPDPVPPAVVRVVADMVVACINKPATTTSAYQAGGYNTQREVAQVVVGNESATSTGPWLTKSLRARLQPFRKRSAYSIDLAPNANSAIGTAFPVSDWFDR